MRRLSVGSEREDAADVTTVVVFSVVVLGRGRVIESEYGIDAGVEHCESEFELGSGCVQNGEVSSK